MTPRTIRGEKELPLPERGVWPPTFDYIRSLSDPKFLIHGWIGTVFVRADGANWEHGAYRASLNTHDVAELHPTTAWFDDAIYRYKTPAGSR